MTAYKFNSAENTEVAGKAAAAAAAAVHGDLNLMQGGLNGTRYPHQMDCSASAPNASNTAFKPFPKRLVVFNCASSVVLGMILTYIHSFRVFI